jgi:uncharacterized membrane protein
MFAKFKELVCFKTAGKALSWRITASTETMFLGWLLTGSLKVGLSIASVEVFSKFFLFYAHERAWIVVPSLLSKWSGVGVAAAPAAA